MRSGMGRGGREDELGIKAEKRADGTKREHKRIHGRWEIDRETHKGCTKHFSGRREDEPAHTIALLVGIRTL
jgi:hypothetical protein